MNNIVSAKLDSRYASTLGVWQYDYGQVLRITGPELPPAVEVQFSLTEKSGETLSRVGTTVDGVTEVKIPDELLTHSATSNYRIYAYIYLTDETSGNTKYEITIPVRVRSRPTSPAEDPETDPDLFRETVVAVNTSAERAKMAEQNAKECATEAGKYAASASESAVTAEKTKEDALRKVGEKKQEAIEAIQNQEETSVGKITTRTDGEIQRIQNQATDSKAGLEQTITNADASKKELEHSIETAGTSKTALDKSVELAGTAKTELDTSIREAGTAKTALDESTETAGTVQETLSATVNQAGALDTSLGEEIETGTQLKKDLVTSGEKAVQDIQAAGSEQLGKMQAVAEAFTDDREQIATNKKDIGSLKEDIEEVKDKKITKFYASNQGENHLADSDNGKIMDMMLYGRSEQKQYKGINLLPSNTKQGDFVEVSIPKETKVFAITDGTKSNGGNFRFFNADKTESMWLGIDKGTTITTGTLRIDAKYVRNLLGTGFDISKICLGIGNEPIYEPYVGGKPSPSPDYPQEIKSVVNPTVKVTNEDGLKVQSVTLNNITLNAIPVASGGNVTIGGQQYIADYVNVERGKVVRMCKYKKLLSADIKKLATSGKIMYVETDEIWDAEGNYTSRKFDMLYSAGRARLITVADSGWDGKGKIVIENVKFTHIDEAKNYFDNNDVYACYPIPTPEEIPITLEEVSTFKQLLTYYSVTNISVNSKQLDGYTVFNYPISMANGWNYVKQQLGDTRDYIYDMDAKAQDIDIQSAEAYVNSEYAEALTELEV